MCVTTLHVSALCVGHYQVCLEVVIQLHGGWGVVWGGGGRDLVMWVFLLGNALCNIGINPFNDYGSTRCSVLLFI